VPRVALGQLNLTVGDLDGNVERMVEAAAEATRAGAELLLFPELAITGYPSEDLVLRPEFVRDNLAALEDLAARTSSACPIVAGFVDPSVRGLHNAAAFLADGEVRATYHKIVLPNYGVFDEQRYFVPGDRTEQVSVGGISVGLSVCEDAWHPGAPFREYRGVPLVANINGSPYHRRKLPERLGVLRDRAKEFGGWIAYANAVGGQDELVFDGGSLVMGPDGEVAARAAMFEEQLLVVDVADDEVRLVDGIAATWPDDLEGVYRALVLGLRDYVRKNGFREVVVGLSGGVDSAFVAVLAADALGPDAVRALAMPSPYSSPESLEDAAAVASATEIRLDVVGIAEPFEAYRGALRPLFEDRAEDVTEENLQARIRGNYLMAVSNKFGSLVLATGNKSEYAVGYATLYGDMAGGFAPIKDVPKTLVYELCRWRNAEGPGAPIVDRVLAKPPSAELRPDQKDTDSLPPYDELDPIVEAYVEDDLGLDEIVARGHDPATVDRVTRMIDRAEYKRRQAAPGIKITPKAFGRDRRMPITNRYVDERTSAPGPVS
jgi:NAD+ synthase (glutamine-hydrolysing)